MANGPWNRWWRLTWISSTCSATPHIRLALRLHFVEESAWTEWQHQADSVTSFPTGAALLVLCDVRDTHSRDFLSSLVESKGAARRMAKTRALPGFSARLSACRSF